MLVRANGRVLPLVKGKSLFSEKETGLQIRSKYYTRVVGGTWIRAGGSAVCSVEPKSQWGALSFYLQGVASGSASIATLPQAATCCSSWFFPLAVPRTSRTSPAEWARMWCVCSWVCVYCEMSVMCVPLCLCVCVKRERGHEGDLTQDLPGHQVSHPRKGQPRTFLPGGTASSLLRCLPNCSGKCSQEWVHIPSWVKGQKAEPNNRCRVSIPWAAKSGAEALGSWVGGRCSRDEEWVVGPARGRPDTDTVLGVPVLRTVSAICPVVLRTLTKALPTKSWTIASYNGSLSYIFGLCWELSW